MTFVKEIVILELLKILKMNYYNNNNNNIFITVVVN
jgi:hypothetical protein